MPIFIIIFYDINPLIIISIDTANYDRWFSYIEKI